MLRSFTKIKRACCFFIFCFSVFHAAHTDGPIAQTEPTHPIPLAVASQELNFDGLSDQFKDAVTTIVENVTPDNGPTNEWAPEAINNMLHRHSSFDQQTITNYVFDILCQYHKKSICQALDILVTSLAQYNLLSDEIILNIFINIVIHHELWLSDGFNNQLTKNVWDFIGKLLGNPRICSAMASGNLETFLLYGFQNDLTCFELFADGIHYIVQKTCAPLLFY